tara:strand:+ start:146 stop:940 length:795 start_codon:yes stop_codon:yes gene_type:complete
MTYDLPTTSKWVRTEELHPKLKYRLNAFFKDDRIRGRVAIVSGVRTLAAQQALYDKYLRFKRGGPRANLAANPARRLANGMVGSQHMTQEAFGGYGFAVDLRIIKKKEITESQVNTIANLFGLQARVPGEWWHFTGGIPSGKDYEWFDAPSVAGDADLDAEKLEPKNALQVFAEAVADARKHVLRQGDRGKPVEVMQLYLEKHGFVTARKNRRSVKGAGIDGIFGLGTRRALIEFQRNEAISTGNKITVDGICGPQTWSCLIEG